MGRVSAILKNHVHILRVIIEAIIHLRIFTIGGPGLSQPSDVRVPYFRVAGQTHSIRSEYSGE